MTLENLNRRIDEALNDGAPRPGAMPQTNVLNAEFALGKYFALLFIIQDVHGIPAMIETKERTQRLVDYLTRRTQEIDK